MQEEIASNAGSYILIKMRFKFDSIPTLTISSCLRIIIILLHLKLNPNLIEIHFLTHPVCDIIKLMPYRKIIFVNNNFYHVFNRGVEKRSIFSTNQDRNRFLETLFYYQFSGPKPKFSTYKRFKSQDFDKNPKIVEIICYCLMPNHFHLLLRQLNDGGIQEFIRKVSNSYTKYFNTKNDRVGHLFQGEFKAVAIQTDEQLIHVSRYIHLNPFVSNLVKDLKYFNYSSYLDFIGERENILCKKEPVLGLFKTAKDYKGFVSDQETYGKELDQIKHLLID